MPVPVSADPSQQMHAELDVTSKDMKNGGSIMVPSPTQSFKVISDELSSIVTPEEGQFVEGEKALPLT